MLDLPPLAEAEIAVVDALVAAWQAFQRLPIEHPADAAEFVLGIHRCQALVLCRPARRALNDRDPA